MEEVPLFMQPSKMSSISSHCIARNLVNCMGVHIEDVVYDWKSGGATEHLNGLVKWLQAMKGWWESDIIVDPSSPMHMTMKSAIVYAAAEKWKNKEIAWAALLTSYLFDSLTIDCICWSTDELTHEVDEELYQKILTRVGPLALKRLKLVSNKLYAWQTRMVRDLLCHSPNVTSVEVPVLSHYILDGIARTANLEELEVVADMYYPQYGEKAGVLEKAAQIFLGTEDYCDLIEKVEEGERGHLPFPSLKKFLIDVDDDRSMFCHAMLCLYPDIKFKNLYIAEVEDLNRLLSWTDDGDTYGGIGSFFLDTEYSTFRRRVLNVDHFISGDSFYETLEEDFDMHLVLNPSNFSIFDNISLNYELMKDLLKNWTSVKKLGIKNTKFLEAIKDSHASQILCIELSKDTCVFQVFDALAYFPNLKHLMFVHPVESTAYKRKDHTFGQIKELTITFSHKGGDLNPELLHVVMASVPSLHTLHLRGVTCGMWTSNYFKDCGHTSVKHITLTALEQLDACPFAWLDSFPRLEELTIKSTIPQKILHAPTSRLNIKYEGVVIPHRYWLGDYETNICMYPDDEVVLPPESP